MELKASACEKSSKQKKKKMSADAVKLHRVYVESALLN